MEHGQGQEQDPRDMPPGSLLFEGSEQHTVEILPDVERLSTRAREQGTIAGVGRDRVTRQVGEGKPPTVSGPHAGWARADELLAVTYQIAGFFTIVIVGVVVTAAVAVLVSARFGA